MTTVTEEDIKNTIVSIHNAFEKELYDKSEAELEENWFFRFDPSASLPSNIYNFHDMLKLYGSFCRRWEEHHNGHICVVERVRDKYLMPKINEFAKQITTACTATAKSRRA